MLEESNSKGLQVRTRGLLKIAAKSNDEETLDAFMRESPSDSEIMEAFKAECDWFKNMMEARDLREKIKEESAPREARAKSKI